MSDCSQGTQPHILIEGLPRIPGPDSQVWMSWDRASGGSSAASVVPGQGGQGKVGGRAIPTEAFLLPRKRQAPDVCFSFVIFNSLIHYLVEMKVEAYVFLKGFFFVIKWW